MAGLIFAATMFGRPALADEASDRAAGEALAQKLCSACHLVSEDQKGPVADGVPPFSVIAKRPGRTVGYLKAFLSDPTPPMPHVPLSQSDVDNIIAYIRSFAD